VLVEIEKACHSHCTGVASLTSNDCATESKPVGERSEDMKPNRREQIFRLLEACHETNSTDLEAQKTAIIGELLAEVEQSGNAEGESSDCVSALDGVSRRPPDRIATK
jgi:hypothetical protein